MQKLFGNQRANIAKQSRKIFTMDCLLWVQRNMTADVSTISSEDVPVDNEMRDFRSFSWHWMMKLCAKWEEKKSKQLRVCY